MSHGIIKGSETNNQGEDSSRGQEKAEEKKPDDFLADIGEEKENSPQKHDCTRYRNKHIRLYIQNEKTNQSDSDSNKKDSRTKNDFLRFFSSVHT